MQIWAGFNLESKIGRCPEQEPGHTIVTDGNLRL
jgi:hypothetical protein